MSWLWPTSKCACCLDVNRCKHCEPNYYQCENDGCIKEHCNRCHDGKEKDLEYCDDCQVTFCSECRFLECSKDEWTNDCLGCLKLIAKTIPKLAMGNEKQRLEIEELKSKLGEQ